MKHHFHALEGGITMTKEEFIKEHNRLIKALKSRDPQLLMKELKEQSEELKKYTGGRAGVSPQSGFIQRLMAENKLKHDGQYKNPTYPLHPDSKMSQKWEFKWKKLANPEQGGENTTGNPYGASPFILKHYKGEPQRFYQGNHPKDYYPKETPTQKKARIQMLLKRLQKLGKQIQTQRDEQVPIPQEQVQEATRTFAEIVQALQPTSTGNQVITPSPPEGMTITRREQEEEKKEEPPEENRREEQPVATPPETREVPKEEKVIKWTIPEDEIQVYSTEDMPEGEAKKWRKLILITKYLGSQAWRIDDVKPREVKEYLESKGWKTGLDSSNLSKGIKEATDDLKDTDVWEEYSSTAEIREKYKEPSETQKSSIRKIIDFIKGRKAKAEKKREDESEARDFEYEEKYKKEFETALYRWCKRNKCPALADFVSPQVEGSYYYSRYMEGTLVDTIEVMKEKKKGEEDTITLKEVEEFEIKNFYEYGYEGKVVFKSGFPYNEKIHGKKEVNKYGIEKSEYGFAMVLDDYDDEFYVSLTEKSDVWFRHEALDIICYIHHIRNDPDYAPQVNNEGKLVYDDKKDEEFLKENPEERPKFEPPPDQTSPYFLGKVKEKKEVKEEVSKVRRTSVAPPPLPPKETSKVVKEKKPTREERFVELRKEHGGDIGLKKIGRMLEKEGYTGVSASNLSIIQSRLEKEGKMPTYKELKAISDAKKKT